MTTPRFRAFLLLVFASAAAGCGYQKLEITPTIDTTALTSAPTAVTEGIRLAVPLADDDRYQQTVGTRGDPRFGAADVTTASSVPELVTDALRQALLSRGHMVTEIDPKGILRVRILECWTALQKGFWAGKAHARVAVVGSFHDPTNGQVLWSQGFTSTAEKSRVQYDSKRNREIVLSQALTDVVAKLLADPELADVLRSLANPGSA